MNEEEVCCPRFDPSLWDEKVLDWDKKKFVRDKVCTLFYIPMNFGSAMKRVSEKMKRSGASTQDGMWLSDHTSKWNMDLYVATDRDVEGAQNVTLSGKFLCKAYEGNFKNTGIWMKDFDQYAKDKGFTVGKKYMWYTACPECAKKHGKEYVIVVGRIRE